MARHPQFQRPSTGRRAIVTLLAATAVMALAGCDDFVRTWHTPRGDAAATYRRMSSEGHGFTVGKADAPQTVYVLFDPQCSHCGMVWRDSQSLLPSGRVKFVWIPVALRQKSILQGAAILASSNPAQTMAAHEELLMSNKGGIDAKAAPDTSLSAIMSNTRLAQSLGIDQVPYLATMRRDGSTVMASGAMSPNALASFVGIGEVDSAPSSASNTVSK